MTDDGTNDLAANRRATADELRRLRDVFYTLVAGWTAAPNSPASTDLANTLTRRSRKAPWGLQPPRTAQTVIASSASAAIDHLHGIAEVLDDDVDWAPMILARSCTEAAAIAAWVLDPDLDVKQRVERATAIRVRGMRDIEGEMESMRPFLGDVATDAELRRRILRTQAVLHDAYDLKLPVHRANRMTIGMRQGPPVVADIVANLFDRVQFPHIALLRSQWSGAVHSGYSSLIRAMTPIGRISPGLVAASLGTRVESRIVAAGAATLAVTQLYEMLIAYFGFDATIYRSYQIEHLPRLQALVTEAVAGMQI